MSPRTPCRGKRKNRAKAKQRTLSARVVVAHIVSATTAFPFATRSLVGRCVRRKCPFASGRRRMDNRRGILFAQKKWSGGFRPGAFAKGKLKRAGSEAGAPRLAIAVAPAKLSAMTAQAIPRHQTTSRHARTSGAGAASARKHSVRGGLERATGFVVPRSQIPTAATTAHSVAGIALARSSGCRAHHRAKH